MTNATQWLTEQGKDYLEGLYAGLPYSAKSDSTVAAKIMSGARARIAGATVTESVVGKVRLKFGLQNRKSARSEPRPVAAVDPQTELPIVPKPTEHGERADWALVGQIKILNGHLSDLKGIWASAVGRLVLAQGKATAEHEPEARPRPVAVAGGAA